MRKADVEPEDLINEISKLIALRSASRQAESS
jgi:hypothetical protein